MDTIERARPTIAVGRVDDDRGPDPQSVTMSVAEAHEGGKRTILEKLPARCTLHGRGKERPSAVRLSPGRSTVDSSPDELAVTLLFGAAGLIAAAGKPRPINRVAPMPSLVIRRDFCISGPE